MQTSICTSHDLIHHGTLEYPARGVYEREQEDGYDTSSEDGIDQFSDYDQESSQASPIPDEDDPMKDWEKYFWSKAGPRGRDKTDLPFWLRLVREFRIRGESREDCAQLVTKKIRDKTDGWGDRATDHLTIEPGSPKRRPRTEKGRRKMRAALLENNAEDDEAVPLGKEDPDKDFHGFPEPWSYGNP